MILFLGPHRSAASPSSQEVYATVYVVMVNPRKLRIVRNNDGGGAGPERTAPAAVAPKGHFAAYTRDGRRFAIPIAFLDSSAFRELLRRSEEEFGLPAPANPSITLPCDAAYMERLVAALGGGGASASASSTKKPRSKAAPAADFFAGAASCLADLT